MTEIARPFRDDHPEMQHLVRELLALRKHNQRKGIEQNHLLLFAEGAVAVIALERLLRILPAVKATAGDTLAKLLRKAHNARVLVIDSPNVERAIKKIVRVRDTTLHANYEQASHQAGCDMKTYFGTQYTGEIDRMGQLFIALVDVVDQRTGHVVKPPTINLA